MCKIFNTEVIDFCPGLLKICQLLPKVLLIWKSCYQHSYEGGEGGTMHFSVATCERKREPEFFPRFFNTEASNF